MSDPFGTSALRSRVLDAWRASPARFREDANAEEDLRLGGYRDRWLVELAANASDAAIAVGIKGSLRVAVSGGELRVANTGAALDSDGVAALASLRASAKREGVAVGRFGVGFSAVLALSDEPAILSTTGAVGFSAKATRQAVAGIPSLREELERRFGEVPVLRLPWQAVASPPAGFSTEVRLPLRAGVDAATVLADARRQAADLLLALPGLVRIEIDDNEWSREQDGPVVVLRGPECTTRWLPYRTRRVLAGDELAGLGVEARQRPEFAVCWALPVDKDGVPVAAVDEVLHAPTPTDEKLSLPARLLATVPLEPGRRRVLPGAATAAMLSAAAETYPGLVRELPAEHRVSLIPTPGFPMSEVDSMLRDGILDALRRDEWLPSVAGGDVTPSSACVLEVVSPRLVELLAGVVPGLLGASFSASRHASGMASLGVRRMGLADVVDALAGVRRPPGWWAELYGALSALESLAISELAGLPVPLVDGRTVLGPRQVLLAAPELSDLLPGLDTAGPVGLRIAHPDAAHPLLQRLGARRAGPPDLLESPELVAAVESSVDDALAGVNTAGLADTVLRLLRETSTGVAEHPWLAALALPDSAGGWRGAGELLLPDAALLAVLDHDAVGEHAPLGVLATSVEQPREVLTATGVLDSFAVLARDAPIAADHDLADEVEWFSAIGGDLNPPDRLVAVRDLDLVADDRWPEALRMLAAEPRTRRALDDPAGYTAWWLRRYAVLAGRAPEQWRLPDASGLAGLYDPLPELGVDRAVLLAVGVRDALEVSTVDDVIALLDRLGDPERVVPQGVVLQVHGALATAVSGELIDTSTVDPPDRVRSLAGTAVDAGSALVADRPWLLALLPEDRTVGVPEGADAAALADLLDVGLASEEMAAAVGGGDPVAWSELGAVLLVCELLGVAVPDGQVVVHEELRVLGGTVRWWSDAGVLHAQDSSEGLARALAWALGRWRQRHLIAAMLDDPDPATLLS